MEPLPPWIQSANPAAYYAQGLQIGARIGEDNTRQQLSQQLAQQELAKQQADEAYRQQVFQLQSQEQARQYAAQQQYQQLINQGTDPAQALLKVGPSLGLGAGDMGAAFRAQLARQQASQPEEVKDIQPKEITIRGINYVYNPATGSFKSEATTKEPIVKAPLDPNNPYAGPTISGPLSDPNIRRALGTNAPPLQASQPTSTNEVIRTTKDGKQAVFDSTTKQFIRYADSNVGGDNTTSDDDESE